MVWKTCSVPVAELTAWRLTASGLLNPVTTRAKTIDWMPTRQFRETIMSTSEEYWFEVLPMHRSPRKGQIEDLQRGKGS